MFDRAVTGPGSGHPDQAVKGVFRIVRWLFPYRKGLQEGIFHDLRHASFFPGGLSLELFYDAFGKLQVCAYVMHRRLQFRMKKIYPYSAELSRLLDSA